MKRIVNNQWFKNKSYWILKVIIVNNQWFKNKSYWILKVIIVNNDLKIKVIEF